MNKIKEYDLDPTQKDGMKKGKILEDVATIQDYSDGDEEPEEL